MVVSGLSAARAGRAAIFAAAVALAGCSEREELLPGERVPVRAGDRGSVIAEAATDAGPVDRGLALPPMRRLAAWPMRVGEADNDPGHASLSARPQRIWSRDIGTGNSRRQRIATDPVSDGARIYALDARSRVTAEMISPPCRIARTASARSAACASPRGARASRSQSRLAAKNPATAAETRSGKPTDSAASIAQRQIDRPSL